MNTPLMAARIPIELTESVNEIAIRENKTKTDVIREALTLLVQVKTGAVVISEAEL